MRASFSARSNSFALSRFLDNDDDDDDNDEEENEEFTTIVSGERVPIVGGGDGAAGAERRRLVAILESQCCQTSQPLSFDIPMPTWTQLKSHLTCLRRAAHLTNARLACKQEQVRPVL
jgi:hypothetical protein